MDGVQCRDVDSELHRRGAEENRQESIGLTGLAESLFFLPELVALALAEAEALLPDLAVVAIDLGGVLACLEPEERVRRGAEHRREVLVEVAEESVLPGTAFVFGQGRMDSRLRGNDVPSVSAVIPAKAGIN